MKKLDSSAYRTMPWKNGGGTTTEIARSAGSGTLDDFDWRVSMAQVATPGPFSRFAGVDRSIALLDGEGMTLVLEGRGVATIDRASSPLAFPADIAVSATLARGPIEDLNVMTRRGRWRHLLTRLTRPRLSPDDATTTLAPLGDLTLFVVARGTMSARAGSAREELSPRDALLVEAGGSIELAPRSEVELLAIDLWRC